MSKSQSWSAMAMLILFLYCCKSETNSQTPKAADAEGTVSQTSCIQQCMNDTTPYQLSSACGECMINNYQNSTTSLFVPEKIKGFEIDHAELVDLLNDMNANTGSKLYAMLSVKSEKINGKIVNSPELVFQVQYNDGVSGYQSDYYDFTQPCPNTCPEDQ